MAKYVKWAGISAALMLTGCGTVGQPYARYAWDSLTAPPRAETVRAPSGERLQLYRLDTGPSPKSIIYFVTGSGCQSLHYYMRTYFRDMPHDVRIYAVQKAGVGMMSAGFTCTQTYYDHDNHGEWLNRNRLALSEVMKRIPEGIDGVLGVSEGGTIAAELAQGEPRIRRVAVIGSGGGMTFGDELRLWSKTRGFSPERALMRAKATPDDTRQREFGLTHRYLTSWMDLDPAPVYLSLHQKVLAVAGENDKNVPIESARLLEAKFKAADRNNYRLIVAPGANHQLIVGQDDKKRNIFPEIAEFFATGNFPD